MESKRLVTFLETIGREIHNTEFADFSGEIRPITKDEQLAREVWRRALGYEKEINNGDGTSSHRIFDPDPKAQAFIFERREGKNVLPDADEKGIPLLDKISALVLGEANNIAEQIVDEDSE